MVSGEWSMVNDEWCMVKSPQNIWFFQSQLKFSKYIEVPVVLGFHLVITLRHLFLLPLQLLLFFKVHLLPTLILPPSVLARVRRRVRYRRDARGHCR